MSTAIQLSVFAPAQTQAADEAIVEARSTEHQPPSLARVVSDQESIAHGDEPCNRAETEMTAGTLLPYIERAFGINYARVSFLSVSTFLGYAVAAICTDTPSRKIGFGKAICLAVIVQLMGTSSTAPKTPTSPSLGSLKLRNPARAL